MGLFFTDKKNIAGVLGLLFCVLMVLFPDLTKSASLRTMDVWIHRVVPSLMPFMMIANYVKKTGAADGVSSNYYALFMAVMSGYPMGAKIAGDYYREGQIQRQELYQILSCSMVTGPAFLIGVIGTGLYQKKEIGFILAFSHYAGAFISSRPYRKRSFANKKKKPSPTRTTEDMIFTNCILDSFQTMGMILAYMMLFMIGMELLTSLSVFRQVSPVVIAMIKGTFEMTVGCSAAAELPIPLKWSMAMASWMVSFGGLSVISQTMSMLQDCPVKFGQVLKMKAVHGAISGIFAFILGGFVV